LVYGVVSNPKISVIIKAALLAVKSSGHNKTITVRKKSDKK
jgi:hypothetical protein